MGLTSRREKIVLFGDSLTQRSIEQGGWGESLVRFFSAILFFTRARARARERERERDFEFLN